MIMKANEIISILGKRKNKGNFSGFEIDGLNLCNRDTEKKGIVSYVVDGKYVESVRNNLAIKLLIVPENNYDYDEIMLSRAGGIVYSKFPEQDFYMLHETLYLQGGFYPSYDFKTIVGENCNIHPSSVIYEGVVIGNNVTIGALTSIKPGTVIDDNVIIGCNTVIGSEGFQLITVENEEPLHVTHTGKTHICSNVYIGDNTCVANSLFEGETYIGKGVKIDNLVYVGHNLRIEDSAVVTAHVILCGSAIIMKGAWIGPNASVLNRVTIGEYAKVGLGSVVTRDVAPHMLVYGVPAKPKLQ